MTQEAQEKSIETQLAELLQLFGPPPVLSSEDIGSYYETMARFLEKFRQRYDVELMRCLWKSLRRLWMP
jgi:hypothetical protein